MGDTSLSQVQVSVIIPAYNAGRYIASTLQSVTGQTHANLEILIIDDGSTDETPDICRRIAADDPRIRIVSTGNRGVAAARNIGIEASTSDYIAFVDADDLWHPSYVETLLSALHPLPPDWGAVYALHRIIDSEGYCTRASSGLSARGTVLARHLIFRFVGNGSGLMIRRAVYDEIGGYDSAYAEHGIGGCEDLDYELRVAEAFKIEAVPLGLVGYRIHSAAMSSDSSRMARSLLAVYEGAIARNLQLPRWVVDCALASVHLYAFSKFIAAKNWKNAANSLKQIFRFSPRLAGIVFFGLILSKLRRAARRAWSKLVTTKNNLMKFEQVDPQAPLGGGLSSFRTEKLLKRLSEVDRALDISHHQRRSEMSFTNNGPLGNGDPFAL